LHLHFLFGLETNSCSENSPFISSNVFCFGFLWFSVCIFVLVLFGCFFFFTGPWSACEVVEANTKFFQFPDNKDNNNSPTHRAITINDIRLARVNNTSTGNGATTSAGGGQSSTMLTAGNSNNNNSLNVNNNQSHAGAPSGVGGGGGAGSNSTSTIITIKQEAMGSNVDNLVGNFVDSTTFLHSPNSQQQMVNPNLVQSTAAALGAATGN
jgi:hypothetical protein